MVVGVSPETGSRTALTWAWEEARMRGVDLLAVSAWRPTLPSPGPSPRPSFAPLLPDELQARTLAHLRQVLEEVLGTDPRLQFEAMRGTVTQVLAKAAADAQLLVLGPPHPSRAAGLLAGGIMLRLTPRVRCPIVVMPQELAPA